MSASGPSGPLVIQLTGRLFSRLTSKLFSFIQRRKSVDSDELAFRKYLGFVI